MALARISDFFNDPDSPLVGLWAPPQVAFSRATNLAFMLVRYRFSITLWAARFAALREVGGWDEVDESFDRRDVRWFGGSGCSVVSIECSSELVDCVETDTRLLFRFPEL